MSASLPVHPWLFAIFPVLSLYSSNQGEVAARDLVPSVAASLLLASTFFLLALAAFRRADRAAGATTLGLVWFWFFAPVLSGLEAAGVAVGTGVWIVAFGAWTAVAALPLVALRRPGAPGPLTAILNGSGAALLLSALVPLVLARGGPEEAHPLADAQVTPVAPIPRPDASALPDVFVIVLDAYGRRDQLREHFDYEDELSEGLERRGFFVASRATANYNATGRSLPSLLNYRYLEGEHFLSAARSVCRSDLRAELSSRGYRFTSCASGFRMSQCEEADRYVEHEDWALLPALSNFEQVLVNGTPLEFWLRTAPATSPYAIHRRRIFACLQALPALAGNGQPDFAFAHVLSPHEPFVFGRDGEDISPYHRPYAVNQMFDDPNQPSEEGGIGPEFARLFRDQSAFIGGEVLDVVDRILARAGHPPILLVVGDHGPRGFSPSLREAQYETLAAFHLPPGGVVGAASEPYPEISLVNALRVVLNRYFEGSHELLPDRHYRKEGPRWVRLPEHPGGASGP